MPWFKVDDKLHDHRKARKAGKAAMGVWVLAGSWSMDNLTDGFVPEDVLSRWGTKADAARLVTAGMWAVAEHAGEQGWRFHDWDRFQPSAAVTASVRAKEAEAGVLGNHRRWHTDRGISDPNCEHCYRVPDREPEGQPDEVPESGAIPPVPVPDTRTSPNGEVTAWPAAKNAAAKPAAKRATQRPESFTPSQAHVDLAVERGVDLRAEWAKFCDWTDANGKTYKDWPAALRNWIRNARPAPGQQPSRVQQHLDLARQLQAEQDGILGELR